MFSRPFLSLARKNLPLQQDVPGFHTALRKDTERFERPQRIIVTYRYKAVNPKCPKSSPTSEMKSSDTSALLPKAIAEESRTSRESGMLDDRMRAQELDMRAHLPGRTDIRSPTLNTYQSISNLATHNDEDSNTHLKKKPSGLKLRIKHQGSKLGKKGSQRFLGFRKSQVDLPGEYQESEDNDESPSIIEEERRQDDAELPEESMSGQGKQISSGTVIHYSENEHQQSPEPQKRNHGELHSFGSHAKLIMTRESNVKSGQHPGAEESRFSGYDKPIYERRAEELEKENREVRADNQKLRGKLQNLEQENNKLRSMRESLRRLVREE